MDVKRLRRMDLEPSAVPSSVFSPVLNYLVAALRPRWVNPWLGFLDFAESFRNTIQRVIRSRMEQWLVLVATYSFDAKLVNKQLS